MRLKVIFCIAVMALMTGGLVAQTTTLSVDTQVAAANITQGSLKQPLFHYHLARNNSGTVNLTGVNFTTAGSYSASDVTKYQLWYNTSDALSSATQLSSDISSGLGTGSHSFATFSQTLARNNTYYFWITTDLAFDATTTHTINVAAWTTSNFTVSSGTTSGSASAGGTQTITTFASLSTDYFRSNGTGDWGTAGTWQSSHDGTNWATATSSPTNTANTITIRNGHTVTVATGVSTDQTTIDAGGQVNVSSGVTLTIANGADATDMTVNGTLRNNAGTVTTTGALTFGSGGLYQHNFTTTNGTIPTATWDTNSTCEIVGYTSYTGDLSITQTYGNFTWNCPNQTGAISANESLDTINGTLKISSTGTGSFVLGNAANITTIGGNLEISGGTFNISAGNALVINLSGNLTISGGTLTETGTGSGAINFAKTGTQVLSITGSPTISNTINFTVNSGAILEFETATTVLSGSIGTFTASSGSSLIIKHASGIASSGSTGCIQTTGTRTFNTGANYTYTGSTAQVTGSGLTGANNLTFSNTAGTTLSAAVTTISGACTIESGATLATNNYNMAFQGNFVNSGTFTAGSSNITIGAGTATQSIAGFTTTGTVSMTKTGGTATLAGNVNGGALTINGNGGTLNLGTGLTHTFTGTWTRTLGTLNGGSSTMRLGAGFSGTGGTFTASTGTVEYYASGTQAIAGVTYNNLTLSGTSAKTTTGATISGILSMEGTATTTGTVPTYGTAATLQYKGTSAQTTGTEFPATFTGTGGVIIANTSGNAVTLGGAKAISAGPLTINTNAILSTNNYGLTLSGNFVNNGTINAGSSAITIAGTATQSIDGFTTTGTVSMTKTGGVATLLGNVSAGALTINGTGGTLNLGTGLTHIITGTWTRTAGTLNGGSSTLKLGGTISGTGTFTANTGTVEYNGTTQSVANLTYNNLTISNSGTKTLAAALTIGTTATLTINGGATLATANYGLIFQGNFVNSGTLTAGSSTVTISGTAATQNIGSFSTTGLVSMTKTAGIATLTGNASGAGLTINGTGGTLNLGTGLTHTFTGTWTRTAGTLDGGSSTLKLSGSVSGTGGTFAPSTGTVEYNASGTQTIAAVTYNNLTLSGTSAKTITGATVNGVFSIEGTATTTGTVLTYGTSASLRYNGSSTQTVGIEWPATFARNITIANTNGVTLDASKTPYTGTITNNGKLNCLSYQLSGTVNNNGTIAAARTDIMSSGTLTNNTGSTIDYTTPLTIPASTGYYNLTLSASGTYLLGGNVTGINVLTLTTATTYLHPSGYTLGYSTLAGLGSIINNTLITLSSSNPAVAAGGVLAGSTNNIFYAFSTAVTSGSATLNSVAFTTAGTAVVTTDLTNFKLWYSTSDLFSGASQLGSTMTTGLSAGTHTFSGLSQNIASGTTGYFWITADLASGATAGRTLQVTPAITTANLTFTSGTKTGTAYEGGLKTISTVFCTTTDYAVAATNVAISQTKVPLYRFTLQNTTGSSINFTRLTFITGGSYVAADVNKFQLWTNTTDNLSGATQVGSDLTTTLVVGSHSFAAFTQALSASSTRYFWITTDFTSSAVVDNVIGVAAFTSSSITLSSGSLTVNAYSGGAQRIISSQVTLRSANPALPAANVGQETTKYPIYRFTVSTNQPVGAVNLTAASFTTAGTYQSTDVSKFQLWTSATDQLDEAVQLGTDITSSLGTGSHSFSSLSQSITAGSTRFFWITTNIPLTAVSGRTINVSAMTTSDITVSAGTKGGTAYASSSQTITVKGWNYTKRQPIAQLSGAGTGYQIKYIVNYGNGTDSGNTVYLNGNCRTDFGDVRFYNGTTELKYWMESMTSGTTATFWVKLAGDLSAGNVNVDINYGNSNALTTSNGLNTFMLFDDFGSDLSKWIKYKYIEGSTITIPSGQSYVRCGGGIPTGTYGHSVAGSYPGYNGFQDNIVEYRYRVGDDAICEVSIRSKFEYSTGTVVAGRGYKARSDQRDAEGQSIHKPPFYGWLFVGGTGDGVIPVIDQWYRGTFAAYGNDMKFYRDGTLMRSITDTDYPEAGEITIQNHYGLAAGSYTDYDWIAVRKNAGAEPTYNAWMYPNHYYRTITSGDWSNAAIWESSPDNTNWSPATMAPDELSMGILIRNTHTVTATADLTADQLVVEAGGKLIINDGITITVNNGTGTDVTINGTLTTLGEGQFDGNGSCTLGAGANLETQHPEGVSTTASTGCIQVTGTLSLDDTVNYTFNGSAEQVTGNAIHTANNLTLDNSTGLTFTNAITINGILYQIDGEITSVTTDYVDGYESQDYNRLRFPETGYNISGWSIAMTTPDLMPAKINRQWVITGSYTNDKVATFFWTSADDSDYPWTEADPPAVYQGLTKLSTTSWSESTPRQITVTLNGGFGAKGTYSIGREDGQTLPVELSSFMVQVNSSNQAVVQWVTQSETGVAGFNIYRGTDTEIANATHLNVFIPATNTSSMQIYQYVDMELIDDGDYYYWLENVDLDGSSTLHGPISFTMTFTQGTTPPVPIVDGITAIYPNPFNPTTRIAFGLTKKGVVNLEIYNLKGQLVRRLLSEMKDKGAYSISWDGTNNFGERVGSAVYLVRMKSNAGSFIQKIVLSK